MPDQTQASRWDGGCGEESCLNSSVPLGRGDAAFVRQRIPVATIVGALAEGLSEHEILRHEPDLEIADIREARRFAAEALQERELPLVPA